MPHSGKNLAFKRRIALHAPGPANHGGHPGIPGTPLVFDLPKPGDPRLAGVDGKALLFFREPHLDLQDPLRLSPEERKRPVRGNVADPLLILEIVGELLRLIRLLLLRHNRARNKPVCKEILPQVRSHVCALAKALREDVPRTIQGRLGVRNALGGIHKRMRFFLRILFGVR